ncbi:MAG: ABC transporter ATP-binding protein, partial [Planctomycetota bacterium]
VLVLDEPTAGVDIELRQMLWANVRRLNDEGVTIILTTHYLEEAEEMCDEIAIVNHGEVIARDKTANLVGRLDAKTLLIVPHADPGPIALPDGVEMTTRPGGALAFSYRRSSVSAEAILDAVRAAGIRIVDVTSEEADLEDVFLALTSGADAA